MAWYTAVAVHPDDETLYQHLIGKKNHLPLMNLEIPDHCDEVC